METLKNIINKLNEAKENDYRLDQNIGLGKNSICRWRSGQSKPNIDACIKIADYFNISLDELVGRKEPTSNATNTPLDPATRELLAGWQNLSNTQKERILGQIQGLQGLNTPRSAAEMFAEGEAKGRAKIREQHNTTGENMA